MLILPGFAVEQNAVATRPAITGISHITLYADNLAKSQQFYGSLLGWVQAHAGGAQSGVRFRAGLANPDRGLKARKSA